MVYPIFRQNKKFFFDNKPPAPHKGWTLQAFQDYCRVEMEAVGFDLTRHILCRYDSKSGNVVFWQEPRDAFGDAVRYSYGVN